MLIRPVLVLVAALFALCGCGAVNRSGDAFWSASVVPLAAVAHVPGQAPELWVGRSAAGPVALPTREAPAPGPALAGLRHEWRLSLCQGLRTSGEPSGFALKPWVPDQRDLIRRDCGGQRPRSALAEPPLG